jgi:hypothetical protein
MIRTLIVLFAMALACAPAQGQRGSGSSIFPKPDSIQHPALVMESRTTIADMKAALHGLVDLQEKYFKAHGTYTTEGSALEVVSKPPFARLRGKHPLSKRGGDESRTHGRAVGQDFSIDPETKSETERGPATRGRSRGDGRDSLGAAHGRTVEGPARRVSRVCDVLASPRRVGARRSLALTLASFSQRSR